MNSNANWTLQGLLSHFRFCHEKMPDHAFVWVLGAGASRASGIPTGGELVSRWLGEMHERYDSAGLSLEPWATPENLGIKDFKFSNAAASYPRVFERRFCDHPDEGYACLEDLMSNIDPSPGYSILAKALETTRHRAVITTNFDNLVADALAIYTDTFPFVCGHESLTSFVRVTMRRPLVCKIHRDLLLGPKNDSRSLKRLHEGWAGVIRSLLSHYTPVVIGYGGNDDSLMDMLESLEPSDVKGQLVWCYYKDDPPSERIRELVAQLHGALVAVPDFDLLMVLLGAELGIQPLDAVLEDRARKRTERYQQRVLALDTTGYPSVATALAATFERVGGWWAWELKARAESDAKRREAVYRQGVGLCPDSFELQGNFALFLSKERPDTPEVDDAFGHALALDSENKAQVGNLTNYAQYLEERNRDEAERLYRRAVELAPEDPRAWAALGLFVGIRLKRQDEAEEILRRAQEAGPNDASAVASLAAMLGLYGRNPKEAESLFKRALTLDPNNAVIHEVYATFLCNVRGDDALARPHYIEAYRLDPQSPVVVVNYAAFLLGCGEVGDALTLAAQVVAMSGRRGTSELAEALFYIALATRCQGRDNEATVRQLRDLISVGFPRTMWRFDRVLAYARKHIDPEALRFFQVLSQVILDASRQPELEQFDEWRRASGTVAATAPVSAPASLQVSAGT